MQFFEVSFYEPEWLMMILQVNDKKSITIALYFQVIENNWEKTAAP
jgi:hypothetical protein